jgi:hypothetical protein
MHTLFQALKQDGLATGTGAAVSASAAPSGAPSTAAAGQYQANLVSSLQTLVAQVGSASAANSATANSATANSATANLNAAYQNLVGTAGAGGLQTFLNNLLQNLQSGGVHSLSGVGNNVNASV